MVTVIPVLLYHGINDNPSDLQAPTTVSPEAFARHMDALATTGARTMTISHMVDQLIAGTFEESSGGRFTVAVTFDDGYKDFLTTALPVMKERSIESTLYVTTGFIDGSTPRPVEAMLDWSDIPELHEAGVEIGAHSHSHPQMDTLLAGRAWEELIRPKALLEDSIGAPVRAFAYPHGYNNRHLRYQARLAGYDSAAAVRNALSHSADDRFRIARLMVMHDTPLSLVRSWISGLSAPLASRHDKLVTRGWRLYRSGKALLRNEPGTVYK